MNDVELGQIDRRFEGYRLKEKNQEKILLTSISEQGVREPLQCVRKPDKSLILLDGFKRVRCCVKLGIHAVPVSSLGSDEAGGILQLVRLSNSRSLNILEQAHLLEELKERHGLSTTELARQLERSPAWVSVRLGLMNDISPMAREALFSGQFPVRSYLYTIRHFTRVNKITKEESETFIKAVSGKGLSVREIETLAYGYFRGGERLKDQIHNGQLEWTLKQLKRREISQSDSLNEAEKRAILDFELVQKYMGKIIYRIHDQRLKTPFFFSSAGLLIEGLLGKLDVFKRTLEAFNDQRRQKKNDQRPV